MSTQVVVHEEQILEKPSSEEEARLFIAGYARSPASTVGSVLCTNLSTGQVRRTALGALQAGWDAGGVQHLASASPLPLAQEFEDVDVAWIHFERIPDSSVDELMREGDCLYCAGGLMVEHPLVAPHVTKMEGTLDSVMGLSKALVTRLLLQAAGVL